MTATKSSVSALMFRSSGFIWTVARRSISQHYPDPCPLVFCYVWSFPAANAWFNFASLDFCSTAFMSQNCVCLKKNKSLAVNVTWFLKESFLTGSSAARLMLLSRMKKRMRLVKMLWLTILWHRTLNLWSKKSLKKKRNERITSKCLDTEKAGIEPNKTK